MPVFRNMSDAQLAPDSSTFPRHVSILKSDLAGQPGGLNQSCQRFDQFCLTIPFDARDAYDLSLANFKRNIVQNFSFGFGIGIRDVLE